MARTETTMVIGLKNADPQLKVDAAWMRKHPEHVRSLQLKSGRNDCFMQKMHCNKVGCRWWEICTSH